jgi:cytosine/adenosine deaminase-related metal-dependent hydrolase
MLLGIDALPPSPAGIRYQDQQIGNVARPRTILSGLADSRTSDLRPLLNSRQAQFLKQYPTSLRRYTEKLQLAAAAASVVLASKPNGLPPGIAQQAELRALTDAGLTAEQALRSAGVNAAAALGLGLQLGRIATGSAADIVLVDGDPLSDIRDAQKIVGVVRNGRFFSAIGLIERVKGASIVE